jgi:hypothetical protein
MKTKTKVEGHANLSPLLVLVVVPVLGRVSPPLAILLVLPVLVASLPVLVVIGLTLDHALLLTRRLVLQQQQEHAHVNNRHEEEEEEEEGSSKTRRRTFAGRFLSCSTYVSNSALRSPSSGMPL